MRTIIALVTSVAAFSAAASQPSAKEKTTFLPKSSYSVIFPGKASCESTALKIGSTTIPKEICSYFEEASGHGFSADYMILPQRNPEVPAQDLLNAAAHGAAENSGSKIASSVPIEVGGYPGVDATFIPVKPGYITFLRYILVDNDLITVASDGYKKTAIPSDVLKFLNSVKIK